MTTPRFGMAVVALSALSCDGICPGTTVPTLELHAELAASALFTADVSTGDELADAHAWHAAIDDATAPAPGAGIVTLKAGDGDVLSLRLPFPLMSGQSLPIEGEASTSGSSLLFSFSASADLTHVGAWLERCPTSGADPACLLAERQEVIGGTLRVESVRPLRVHVSASVSYGDATALTSLALDGDLTFAATEGTRCLD